MIPRDARTCPACRVAPVVWAVTEAGKRQALNPEPDPDGNVAAYRDGLGAWRARTLTGDQQPYSHEKRYMPHAAVCELLRTGSRPAHRGLQPVPAVLPAGVTSLDAYRRAHPRRQGGTR
jgi:hypothetical protein